MRRRSVLACAIAMSCVIAAHGACSFDSRGSSTEGIDADVSVADAAAGFDTKGVTQFDNGVDRCTKQAEELCSSVGSLHDICVCNRP